MSTHFRRFFTWGSMVAALWGWALTGTMTGPAAAAELVMFESSICEYCEMWHEELGDVYAKTDEGRQAPLRRVDIYDERPADLKDIRGIHFTPTFVLLDGSREVGRIMGYPGESFFWEQLSIILKHSTETNRLSKISSTRLINTKNQ